MTIEEQQIWDMVHKFCESLYMDIPDMSRRYLMDEIKSYASQQRLDGIKEGFVVGRESKDLGGVNIAAFLKYRTFEDYLNNKK